MIKPEFAERYH